MIKQLPAPATDYIRCINCADPDGFVALFAEDAVVDDVGRIIRGADAIRRWASSDIFAVNVALDPLDALGDEHDVTMTTRVDGTFDRAGLPDPLVMTVRVVSANGRIAALTCRLADT